MSPALASAHEEGSMNTSTKKLHERCASPFPAYLCDAKVVLKGNRNENGCCDVTAAHVSTYSELAPAREVMFGLNTSTADSA